MKKITSLFLGLMLVSSLASAVEYEKSVDVTKIDKRIEQLKEQRVNSVKQLEALSANVQAITGAIMILEEIKIKEEAKKEEVKK